MNELLLTMLAAWRLAHLLVHEDGPWAIFARLRHVAGLRSVVTKDFEGRPQASKAALTPIAEGLSCLWCVSVWVAAVLVLWGLLPGQVVHCGFRIVRDVLAVSAGAIVAQECIERLRGNHAVH